MGGTAWNGSEATGARDRIVRLLRNGQYTVEALAVKLGVTRNAVRAQIALLRRENLVEIRGEVKGARRPAAVYGLRPGADVRFSRAYPVVLSRLIGVLSGSLPDKQFRATMRELGIRLAELGPPRAGTPRERVRAALEFLRSLGSAAESVEEDGRIVITGNGCPIGEAVSADKRSCLAMAALLETLTGLPVAEACRSGEQPGCRFEISLRK